MVLLRDENANLWEVIRTKLGDDVEKGEGKKVMNMLV